MLFRLHGQQLLHRLLQRINAGRQHRNHLGKVAGLGRFARRWHLVFAGVALLVFLVRLFLRLVRRHLVSQPAHVGGGFNADAGQHLFQQIVHYTPWGGWFLVLDCHATAGAAIGHDGQMVAGNAPLGRAAWAGLLDVAHVATAYLAHAACHHCVDCIGASDQQIGNQQVRFSALATADVLHAAYGQDFGVFRRDALGRVSAQHQRLALEARHGGGREHLGLLAHHHDDASRAGVNAGQLAAVVFLLARAGNRHVQTQQKALVGFVPIRANLRFVQK